MSGVQSCPLCDALVQGLQPLPLLPLLVLVVSVVLLLPLPLLLLLMVVLHHQVPLAKAPKGKSS